MPTAMTSATASATSAEICPLSRKTIMAASRTTRGSAAQTVGSHQWCDGSYACIQEVIPGEPSNATIQDGIKFSNKWIVMQGHQKVCAHLECPPIIDWVNEDVNIFWFDALLMN